MLHANIYVKSRTIDFSKSVVLYTLFFMMFRQPMFLTLHLYCWLWLNLIGKTHSVGDFGLSNYR